MLNLIKQLKNQRNNFDDSMDFQDFEKSYLFPLKVIRKKKSSPNDIKGLAYRWDGKAYNSFQS
jgi:hypothetical protein